MMVVRSRLDPPPAHEKNIIINTDKAVDTINYFVRTT